MMILSRVMDSETAKVIALGVRKHNHISCTTKDALSQPHFAVMVDDQLTGWLGYRRSRKSKDAYEIMHMGILPEFRRQGLAKQSVLEVLDLVYAAGGKRAFVRINFRNEPSMDLAKDMGFHLATRIGKVNYFSRKLDGHAVPVQEAAEDESEQEVHLEVCGE